MKKDDIMANGYGFNEILKVLKHEILLFIKNILSI